MDYCKCPLPIRMVRRTADMYKTWYCAKCELPVDPTSKAIDKHIDNLVLKDPTRNEIQLEKKVNEILDLLRSNGGMI